LKETVDMNITRLCRGRGEYKDGRQYTLPCLLYRSNILMMQKC